MTNLDSSPGMVQPTRMVGWAELATIRAHAAHAAATARLNAFAFILNPPNRIFPAAGLDEIHLG
jgi:hypothetical protein